MAADPVTPLPGLVTTIVNGGTPVEVAPGGVNGGFIQNPNNDTDQGVPAEPLYVNAIDSATLNGFGNTFRIEPGGTWFFIPGQTTPTSVNAATSGHRFSVVRY